MNRTAAMFILTKIAEECKKAHMDSEAEAVNMAIYDMGIVEEMKKQRDAMMEFISNYEDTDLVKTKYIRQVMGEYGK